MSGVDLGDLITPSGVMLDLPAPNKRHVLTTLAAHAAALAGQDPAAAIDVIREREALGSTGFGAGAAIPHGRLATLNGIVVVVARLAQPVDYAALDGLPVDIVVLMLAASNAGVGHLKALARISRALRDAAFCQKLRGAATADAFYALLAGDRRHAA